MTIAIEPVINQGVKEVKTLDDGWTTVTRDGKLSAHFERTIAITEKGPVIMTEPAYSGVWYGIEMRADSKVKSWTRTG